MISISHTALGRTIGLAIGIAIAAAFLLASRPDAQAPDAPAGIRLTVPLSGELEVTPSRPVLSSGELTAGGPAAAGSFRVRNQTGEALTVGFRAESGSTALDGLLRVRLSSSGAQLADTTLQGLRSGTPAGLRLLPGDEADVQVQAWIPPEVTEGYQARHVTSLLTPTIADG
jgi:hypothetical protein